MSASRRIVSGPKSRVGKLTPLSDTAKTVGGSKPATTTFGEETDEAILAEAATVSPPRERPQRPVYLVTMDKADPMKRKVRDVTRQYQSRHEGQAERRPKDDVKDLINRCQGYTEHFNTLLKSLPRKDKRVVEMVIQRMRAENIAMDQQTYNLLLEKVADLRDPLAFEIYEDFKIEAQREDANVRPDSRTFELMVRACERNGDYRRAFHIYSQMKDTFGVHPEVALYNTLIGYCAPLGDEAMAASIIEEMKERSVDLDVHTYNALMNVFADAPYADVLKVYEDLVRRKLKPNRRTFNTLMKACQRVGDYDRVFQFFEEMKQEGLTPDVTTYNVLIAACRDRLEYVVGTGKYSDVRRTKEQKELGMKAIAQLCISLKAEMLRLGVPPNTFTYNVLLSVLSRCHDMRLFPTFEEMKAKAEEPPAPVDLPAAHQLAFLPDSAKLPTVQEQEAMLEAAIAASTSGVSLVDGDLRVDTDDTTDQLGAIGVLPNLQTYTTMLEGCHLLEKPDEAYELYREMTERGRGLKPDRHIYIRLIDVCALKHDKAKARTFFDMAEVKDTETYNAFLNVLAECSDSYVFTLFAELKQDREARSVKPNQDSYNLMLKAALRRQDVDLAKKMYDEMTSPTCVVAPDTVSYGILMDVCAACKDVELAAYYMEEMRRRHVPPTVNTYSRFMNVFVVAKDPGVTAVFASMLKYGPQPNLEAYTTLLQHYRNTENDAITALFEDMKREGVDPDLGAYNIMMRYAADIGNPQRANKYLDEMRTRGLNCDLETYNALIAVYANGKLDTPERIVKAESNIGIIFDEMSSLHVDPDKHTLGILGKNCVKVLENLTRSGRVRVEGDTLKLPHQDL